MGVREIRHIGDGGYDLKQGHQHRPQSVGERVCSPQTVVIME